MGLGDIIQKEQEKLEVLNQVQKITEETIRDSRELLNLISKTKTSLKAVLNDSESRVYQYILRAVYIHFSNNKTIVKDNVILLAQVAMSSFVSCSDKVLWYKYNKMYVDFMLINKKNKMPLCVIEYFGSGHYPDNSDKQSVELRDALKQDIFNKLGLKYIILTDEELKLDKFSEENNTEQVPTAEKIIEKRLIEVGVFDEIEKNVG